MRAVSSIIAAIMVMGIAIAAAAFVAAAVAYTAVTGSPKRLVVLQASPTKLYYAPSTYNPYDVVLKLELVVRNGGRDPIGFTVSAWLYSSYNTPGVPIPAPVASLTPASSTTYTAGPGESVRVEEVLMGRLPGNYLSQQSFLLVVVITQADGAKQYYVVPVSLS